MRILLVNAHGTDPGYGGAERRVRYLATGLSDRGHEVQVLSAFPQRGEPSVETHVLHRTDWRQDPVRRMRNHIGDVVSAPWPQLRAVMNAASPDLVHTHNLPGIGTGVWEVARLNGSPVVHSILDYYLLCPRTSLIRRDGSPCTPNPLLCGARTRRLTRWHAAVDTVLGTSNYVLRRHEGMFPGAVQHAMPPPLKPLSGPQPPPVRTPPATLGYMGPLTAEKGVALLLDAAPSLARAGLSLRIAGDGPLRGAVERAQDIEYEGRLEGEALAAFLGSCDVGMVPSMWDEPGGGPFVLGEWLGAGRPVLATRRGGLAEIERSGGVVSFSESAEGLVDAALSLRDRSVWEPLLATVPEIDGDADLDRWLDKHVGIYEAAVERGAAIERRNRRARGGGRPQRRSPRPRGRPDELRVLLVNAHGADPEYGGAERYVRDLALGLSERGHEAVVLSAFPFRADVGVETETLHQVDWRDSELRRLRNHAGDLVSAPWPRINAYLQRLRPDLVHTSNLPGIGSGIWEAARRNGIPVVHSLHDYHLLCPRTTLTRRDGTPCSPSPMLCGLRTRRLARWEGGVRQVIAGSNHLLQAHRGLFSAAQERVIRLPLAPVAEAPIAPPGRVPATLGYLGTLTAPKGVELLLAAAPALAEEGIAVRIAGDGPLREEVAAAGVEYVGRVEGSAKVDFLISCDLGVVPSLWEEPSGPPYVVCEWLGAGRPVLTTRHGALQEVLSGGAVPFDASPAGLVDAAVRVRDDDEWRRILATVPSVDGDADVDRWLDEHESVYAMAVDATAGPDRA